MNTSCIAAERGGPIYIKIKKELCKAGLLTSGTQKTKLKRKICNRIDEIEQVNVLALSVIYRYLEQYW